MAVLTVNKEKEYGILELTLKKVAKVSHFIAAYFWELVGKTFFLWLDSRVPGE